MPEMQQNAAHMVHIKPTSRTNQQIVGREGGKGGERGGATTQSRT